MPFAPSEFSDRANVAIPLLEPGRGLRAELGITSRWDQDPYCPSLASLIDSFVNGPGVIRAVGGYGRNGVIKLLKQVRDRSAVMRSASGQMRRDDLTCISINSEVELPPSPVPGRFLQMADVNPEPCTVDEYVDRPIGREAAKPNAAELCQTPRQCGVIRDREIRLE